MLFDSSLRNEHRAFAAQDAARRAERARDARGAIATRATVEIEYLPFGPADESGAPTCEIVAAYAEVELEYAAIRGGCALVDCPQRGTVVLRGADRFDFVNRLVTQELRKLADGAVAQAFLTNRKGRIDADLVIAAIGDLLVIDTLAHDVAAVREALEKMLFSEDVRIESRVASHARIALHGAGASQALKALGLASQATGVSAWSADLGDARAEIWRLDELGTEGYALSVPVTHASSLWRSLVTFGVRPAGWFATNTARIEAGTPCFRIDFGPNNLPHESGLLDSRVSFTKGCYPGQEVVARLQHLGKPKQKLVGLRIESDLLPVADAQVFAFVEGGSIGDAVGVVTSSGLAPMLGAVPVAFAMIGSSAYAEGTKVLVNAEGEQTPAIVTRLAFLDDAPTGELA
jgi:folate-binding protein YgfZ